MKNPFELPDETRLSQVHLRTRHLEPITGFYERILGLKILSRTGGQVAFCAICQSSPMLVFSEDPTAAPRSRSATGLYHIAIRFPLRRDLACALRRLTDRRYPIEGAADHMFSESIYLADPDGNGVELYVDSPRSQWPRKDRLLTAASNPLDMHSLLASIGPDKPPMEAPSGTDIGHLHLQVASLAESERFYREYFGLDVTIREMPGALFFSAGGYHHHIGINTWAGSSPRPPNSTGLVSYRFSVPMPEVLYCLRQRAPLSGYETETLKSETGSELLRVRDPNGDWLELLHG